ncbi:MAG TPA: hypothetical protein VFD82_01390 [Planctomycetota bacterium]|nr:hypothetical protein [Planctomycetota bacterium]
MRQSFLRAYRWQFIGSGVTDPRFQKILGGMIDEAQMARIGAGARADPAMTVTPPAARAFGRPGRRRRRAMQLPDWVQVNVAAGQ